MSKTVKEFKKLLELFKDKEPIEGLETIRTTRDLNDETGWDGPAAPKADGICIVMPEFSGPIVEDEKKKGKDDGKT